MTGLRLLAAALAATALAAGGAAMVVPRRPPGPAAEPASAVVAATGAAFPAGTPVPDAREVVPPGILARAAGARALERAPVCVPTPAPETECAPPRDSVEIEWDVGREP